MVFGVVFLFLATVSSLLVVLFSEANKVLVSEDKPTRQRAKCVRHSFGQKSQPL